MFATRLAVVGFDMNPEPNQQLVHGQIGRRRACVRYALAGGGPFGHDPAVLAFAVGRAEAAEVEVAAVAGRIGEGDDGLPGRSVPSVPGKGVVARHCGELPLR
jgi:hypothetical protein